MKSLLNLLFWGTVFLIIWTVSYPFKRTKENCFSWAVKQWESEGGYLVIRWAKSDYKYPHFLWMKDQNSPMEHISSEEERWWFTPNHRLGDD